MWDKLLRVILPRHDEPVGGKGRHDQPPFLNAALAIGRDEGGQRLAQERAQVKGCISSLVLAVCACGGEAAPSVTVGIVEPADTVHFTVRP